MNVVRLTNHGALRHPPEDTSAAFLGQGWWTLEMLKPIIWHLEQAQPPPLNPNQPSSRHEYFQKRLHDLGAFDPDSDYNGMIGKAVEELSKTFETRGHSGMSAVITMGLFNQLHGEWQRQELK